MYIVHPFRMPKDFSNIVVEKIPKLVILASHIHFKWRNYSFFLRNKLSTNELECTCVSK